jgi:hypothetical protein
MAMSKPAKARASREERLRQALRENLKRRRAQARGREEAQRDQDEPRRKPETDERP